MEDMKAWNAAYDVQREINKRRHSPMCTETMMKGYRCMKKNPRSECEELLEAVRKCRHPDISTISTLERKPTEAPATTTAR